jgi:hypothetical protein
MTRPKFIGVRWYPSRSVALFKKLDSVAITPLFAYYVRELKSDRQ